MSSERTSIHRVLWAATGFALAAMLGLSFEFLMPAAEAQTTGTQSREAQSTSSSIEASDSYQIMMAYQDSFRRVAQAVLPGPTMGVLRIDLEGGGWDVIFEHPEITNSHLQYNPVNGRDILVQHNRGSRMAADGTILKRGDAELGATLMVIDGEGGNCRKLPAGPPHTAGCTGHECFVADTGKVAFTVNATGPNRELDSRYPEGNLFTAGPGDAEPTVFAAPEHYFNHLCVSKCGKYFVCDSYPKGLPGPVAIVIGNLQSGKYRAIVKDCRSTLSGAQCRHPHPYLTSENRHVVYNSDCDAIPHVYFAEVPDGFLAGLD